MWVQGSVVHEAWPLGVGLLERWNTLTERGGPTSPTWVPSLRPPAGSSYSNTAPNPQQCQNVSKPNWPDDLYWQMPERTWSLGVGGEMFAHLLRQVISLGLFYLSGQAWLGRSLENWWEWQCAHAATYGVLPLVNILDGPHTRLLTQVTV